MNEKESQDETQPVRPQGEGDQPAEAPVANEASASPSAGVDAGGDAGVGLGVGAGASAPAARRGFREQFRGWRTSSDGGRTYSLGALIASALAGVIVGGIGLASVQAIADDRDDRPGRFEHHGPMGRDGFWDRDFGDRDFDDRGPMFRGPGERGRLLPTTPPEDNDNEDSGVS
jgi:hypothetical protein